MTFYQAPKHFDKQLIYSQGGLKSKPLSTYQWNRTKTHLYRLLCL